MNHLFCQRECYKTPAEKEVLFPRTFFLAASAGEVYISKFEE